MDKMSIKPDVYLMARDFVRAAEQGLVKEGQDPYDTFFSQATPAENDIIRNAGKRGAAGKPDVFQEPAMQEYLKLAEIYAAIAERTGQHERLRKFLPVQTRSAGFSLRALRRGAPAFAMLCCPIKVDL